MMERSQLGGRSAVEIQHTLAAVEHNLRVSGETDNPVRMSRLAILPGMKLQRAYNNDLWTVVRKFANGQTFMKKDNSENKYDVWGKQRLCRVPKGLNEGI